MKKLLLGTTTLLAASVLLSAQSFAGTVPTGGGFDLTIAGKGTFEVQYKSRESKTADTPSKRNHNLDFTSSLTFKGSKTFDSGTSAGFEIGLTTATAVTATDHIWVKGNFGNFYLGDTASKTLELGVKGTYSGVGLLAATVGSNAAAIGNTANISGTNTKIAFQSNAMSGITVAVNYTPDAAKDVTANGFDTTTDATGEDILFGLKWEGTFGDATTSISFGYGVAKAEGITGDKDVEDNKRMRVGFNLVDAIPSLTIGGYWLSHADNSVAELPTEDETSVGLGGNWVTGDWTIGLNWETSSHEELTDSGTTAANTVNGTDKATRADIGVAYKIDDDRTIKVGYRQEKHQDDQNLAADENATSSIDVKFDWAIAPGLGFAVGLQSFSYTHHVGLATSAKKNGSAAFIQTKVTF